jgi:S-formylglutathione hydrolase FrmB
MELETSSKYPWRIIYKQTIVFGTLTPALAGGDPLFRGGRRAGAESFSSRSHPVGLVARKSLSRFNHDVLQESKMKQPMHLMHKLVPGVVTTLCFLSGLGLAAEKASPKSVVTNVPAQAVMLPVVTTNQDGCTVVKFTVASACMKREIQAVVMLPPEYQKNPGKRFPVIYALHGMNAPWESWQAMPKLSQELVKYPMIVVSFNGDEASWYLDAPQKSGSQFTMFFFKELISYVDSHYRTIADGKGRAITGFSMGGFGAFHYLLEQPGAFASISSLSGAFHPSAEWKLTPLLGMQAEYPEAYRVVDLRARINAAQEKGAILPPFYLHCGTGDDGLAENRDLRDFLKSKNLSCEYVESDGGHNWAFWKEACVGVLDFHWKYFKTEAGEESFSSRLRPDGLDARRSP